MNRLILFILLGMMFFSCEEKETMIEIKTDFGIMKAKLYDSTPKHRDNMVKLIKEGFYDGLLFHRVIDGFMIQGGDPQSRDASPQQNLGGGGPGYQIDAEIGGLHFKGVLAAARTGDAMNPEKRSSGSQFYIVQGRTLPREQLVMLGDQAGVKYTPEQIDRYMKDGGTPFLDNGYTAFGEIVEGLDVLDKIATVKTAPGDRPLEDIKMTIRVLN